MKSLLFRNLYELITLLALAAMFTQLNEGSAIAQMTSKVVTPSVQDLPADINMSIVLNH